MNLYDIASKHGIPEEKKIDTNIQWCIDRIGESKLHVKEFINGESEFNNKCLVHINVLNRMNDLLCKILEENQANAMKAQYDELLKGLVRKEVTPDFEGWLMEYHCEQYPEILDDMLPDCFNDWVCELDMDDWIRLGNKYAEALANSTEIVKRRNDE